jgi:hypothetical protein
MKDDSIAGQALRNLLRLHKFLRYFKERRPEGPKNIAQGTALGKKKNKKGALKGRHTPGCFKYVI